MGNPGGAYRGGAGSGTAVPAREAQKIKKDGSSLPSFFVCRAEKKKAGTRTDFFLTGEYNLILMMPPHHGYSIAQDRGCVKGRTGSNGWLKDYRYCQLSFVYIRIINL